MKGIDLSTIIPGGEGGTQAGERSQVVGVSGATRKPPAKSVTGEFIFVRPSTNAMPVLFWIDYGGTKSCTASLNRAISVAK